MNRQKFCALLTGLIATCTLPLVLAGCGGKETQTPAGGYPGGQKPGAVANTTADPNYEASLKAAKNRSQNGYSGSSGAPAGYPGSTGR